MNDIDGLMPPVSSLLDMIPESYFDSSNGQPYDPARRLYFESKINYRITKYTYQPEITTEAENDD